ncbi:glycine cleavage system T protein [Pseudogymnoascus sp. 03VT05]|nr:glycine cleavage system T protein [Pseudogymnoascus sp. 03VT05]
MKSLRSTRYLKDVIAARNALPRSSGLITAATRRSISTRTSQRHILKPTLSVPATPLQTTRHASSSAAPEEELSKTPLYDFHVRNGGKMVPFGGYAMPVQYSSLSVLDSHNFTRTGASLFDVSHMVQHHFTGPGAAAFLERITPSDVEGLPVHGSTLSTLLLPSGGIVDDLIITKLWDNRFYVVTNAGCREKDLKYLKEQLKTFRLENSSEIEWTVLEGKGLIALQGPKAKEILSKLVADPARDGRLSNLYFGQSRYMKLRTAKVGEELPFQSSLLLVSRGGYTGEDGFEISIPAQETERVTEMILEAGGPEMVQLAGLGARDSLRLEAGMCLYGHDLNETITPVEAGMSWIIGKRRRAEGGFLGAETILPQLKPKAKGGQGIERRRVGLIVEGPPAREGAVIRVDGKDVGVVTSGCPSPCLKKNIAMGYIQEGLHKSGTPVEVVVRGKARKAEVAKMPFLATGYYKQEE